MKTQMRPAQKRRARRTNAAACCQLHPLEGRIFLHGTTVITHGWQASRTFPNWLNTMKDALVARLGNDTTVLKLTINADANASLALLSGPLPNASSKAETILMIDWAAASDILSRPFYSTTEIAGIAAPYLTSPLTINNTQLPPLAQGPMHFLGHSRGASLISELARILGNEGIWVDQLTTLDPYPVAGNDDAAVSPTANVLFVDNYYQTTDLFIHGAAVPGAFNAGPLSLPGGHGSFDSGDHADIHSLYHGTIDTTPTASDGELSPIPANWYPTNGVNRAATGFSYSRTAGGARPLAGLSTDFGGNATRSAVAHTGTPWPNVGNLQIQGESLAYDAGDSIFVSYLTQNLTTSSTARFFLDPDQNPYNGNEVTAGLQIDPITGLSPLTRAYALSTSLAQQGSYYVMIKADSDNLTRVTYASTLVFIFAPSLVVGRRIFYNDSAFDGNNPAASTADDAAIAPDKYALLQDDSGTFGSYTSYHKGLNGVMIDIAGVIGTITPADLIFKIGNTSDPDTWSAAPSPVGFLLRPGAGEEGSTRIHITWANHAIKNTWLQITMKANGNTALASDEIFYFGNAVGEVGDSGSNAHVNAVDEISTRFNAADLTALPSQERLASPYDFNRDGHVNAEDVAIAGSNYTHFLNALNLIVTPPPPLLWPSTTPALIPSAPIQPVVFPTTGSTAVEAIPPSDWPDVLRRQRPTHRHTIRIPQKLPAALKPPPKPEKVQTLHKPTATKSGKLGKGLLFSLRHFGSD